ncbi:hypothetical protein GUJ93_ZPchr0012g21327 [Zizania palustris]|uniref:Uncharacterized protein n=1 Tax=Zizania palustris TaxID=103762 RepID=A0A8J5WWW0_ZIZPA|nr:hypothetical protein GUJ93_ZPchr0012g21327 [Zizania palustris]
MDEEACNVEGHEWALTCVGDDGKTNTVSGHEIDWDSIIVEERSSEEGRHDVTSEQALYIQLGLGTEVEEAFIQREDDVSGPSHGNTRNGDPRNHCEDGMGAAIPCSDVLFDETRTIFDIVNAQLRECSCKEW